ncbi:MAG: iron-sulfur binding hydrogenase [Candidatus Muiribacterium halophilum]|uniref:Iron-sulfur binding hydrogenase n=1 Tax=Muiribacterium halophilum TaxID=2053465 RepID=A0A2N5ZFN2_MUIH1|nr:MAG: iron-sulfur binding hydrogenase [Candidatus Muirbacterium halophilum]
MRISEIIEKLSLKLHTSINDDMEIERGYVSEMLSDVMANCPDESLLVTILSHENVIAVCILKDIKFIILANSRKPNDEMLKKALDEDIVIATAEKNAFQISQSLLELNVR